LRKTFSLDVLMPQISTFVCMNMPRFSSFDNSIARRKKLHAAASRASFAKC